MKMLGKLITSGVVAFAVLQTIRPSIPIRPATAELQAPIEIRHILEKGCYSCHSDDLRLAWFDQIVPGYWLVRHDVLRARKRLNFSTLGSKPIGAERASLFESVNMIQLGAMPLRQFTRLHPEAKITPENLQMLKDYLAPWAPLAPPSLDPPAVAYPARTAHLYKVRPESNGVAFDPDFMDWKLLSTTDRGDNSTFRFILGNDIAIEAVRSGNISPWPDGARLAKIAWQQELGTDGLVHPGKFIQIELMIKNAQKYKATEGWGWGRWRGVDLKPYGKDASFVSECTVCHMPLHGNDFVYTLPMSRAKIAGEEIVNNHAANLPSTLPYQPLGWNALTMYVDRNAHTTATLYGNDVAVQFMKDRNPRTAGNGNSTILPVGAALALVSWQQRDDPHWFGARIPDTPETIEFVRRLVPSSANEYMVFSGPRLVESRVTAVASAQRMAFVLGLTPAILP